MDKLENGMVVELRDGSRHIFIENIRVDNDSQPCDVLLDTDKGRYFSMDFFNHNLEHKYFSEFDIMFIYRAEHFALLFRPSEKLILHEVWRRESEVTRPHCNRIIEKVD